MEPLTLTLTGIAHGGEAIARQGGKVIFVPYSLPGETVQVEIVEDKGKWARARLLSVITPSPDRIQAPCPYFGPGQCGGCQWQHIRYERQLEFKREIVRDQLQRLGRLKEPVVLPTRPTGPDYEYRNHVEFGTTPEGALGFRRADSHEIIPIERCLITHTLVDELHAALYVELPELRRIGLRAGVATGQQMITFQTVNDQAPELEIDMPVVCALLRRDGEVEPLIGDPWIEEQVAGRPYRISAGSFFQVNTAGAEVLVELVRTYAGPLQGKTVLDAYCGVGLFALALAGEAGQVIGVEESPAAMEDAAWNAREFDNILFHEGSVAEVLPTLDEPIAVVVVDPPRAGLGAEVITEVARLSPARVVYVSCDPATLARDAQGLMAAGYRLVEVQPVDMFPQTYHIESVALWQRHLAA